MQEWLQSPYMRSIRVGPNIHLPRRQQPDTTWKKLLTLARSLEPEHLTVIRESRMWIDLKCV